MQLQTSQYAFGQSVPTVSSVRPFLPHYSSDRANLDGLNKAGLNQGVLGSDFQLCVTPRTFAEASLPALSPTAFGRPYRLGGLQSLAAVGDEHYPIGFASAEGPAPFRE